MERMRQEMRQEITHKEDKEITWKNVSASVNVYAGFEDPTDDDDEEEKEEEEEGEEGKKIEIGMLHLRGGVKISLI